MMKYYLVEKAPNAMSIQIVWIYDEWITLSYKSVHAKRDMLQSKLMFALLSSSFEGSHLSLKEGPMTVFLTWLGS